MILTQEELDQEMTAEQQKFEINRAKEAPNCMVLYKTFAADKKTANICETILHLAGCEYHESWWLSRGIVNWVKGSIRMHFEVA